MIYLDYNATTPIDRSVADAMMPFLFGNFGNPSSRHSLGIVAKKAIEHARSQIAGLLNCAPAQIIFTSGGSESNNMVLKSVAFTCQRQGRHIITSQIEHPSVINPCRFLERIGYEISYLPVDQYGIVDPGEVEKHITDQTILVTVMHSNNETGSLQPIEAIAEICRGHNILCHTDASQSVGKVPVDVQSLGIDFLTLAGHKLYAPKGIGALYIRQGAEIEPLIHGAGHEDGLRAGTENIIFDVALGKACEIAVDALKSTAVKQLTNYFFQQLQENFKDRIHLNGHPDRRLPNTLNVSFLGHSSQAILNQLNDIAASTGSACHSALTTISPVLKAMGVSEQVGFGAVRFSLGRYTTREEIDTVMEKLINFFSRE